MLISNILNEISFFKFFFNYSRLCLGRSEVGTRQTQWTSRLELETR